jgi:hypothetical protein
MYLKFKEKVTNSLLQIDLIDDDYEIAVELSLFAFNIRKELCGVLENFLSFKKIEKKCTTCFFNAKPYI